MTADDEEEMDRCKSIREHNQVINAAVRMHAEMNPSHLPRYLEDPDAAAVAYLLCDCGVGFSWRLVTELSL